MRNIFDKLSSSKCISFIRNCVEN